MSYKILKRSFDLIFSFILFILFIPLWIAIPLLIKLDSQGRIIFTQKRVGKNSDYFTMYKFRTMKEGTPDIPTDELKNQAELNTRFGSFLRRLSLDEIPQLINIIKGEMSFVGPRPALYNQEFLIELRKKNGVDKITPGVTGLAQISGRDAIPIPKKVEYDIQYMKKISIIFDIKIIFLTAKAAITGKGAN